MLDVVAVGHDRDQLALAAELREHVAVGIDLAVSAPCRDGRVLRRRDGEARHRLRRSSDEQRRRPSTVSVPMKLTRWAQPPSPACSPQVTPRRAEVVQLERDLAVGIVARPLQAGVDDLLAVAGHGRDRRRIPDRSQQRRLHECGEPGQPRIGVADLDQRGAEGNGHAFRQRLDFEREHAVMLLHDDLPARAIERQAVRKHERLGFVDLLLGDGR